jgi:spermidine synthase
LRGVARECVSRNFNFIDWFELDPEVVEVCNKHLGSIGKKSTKKNSVKCVWGDAFENAGLKLNKDKDRAAIIVVFEGGVARECVSRGFGFIDWFELDPEVVEVCNKHLGSIGKKSTKKNSVKCVWGDAFENAGLKVITESEEVLLESESLSKEDGRVKLKLDMELLWEMLALL